MKIAIYGMPCSGKSTLMSAFNHYKTVNGSEELKRIAGGKFSALTETEKEACRIEYIKFLQGLPQEIVVSDGHYAFLDNVVFTEQDGQAYDIFIYLHCEASVLQKRYQDSEKNQKFSHLSVESIDCWQDFEIESLRKEAHLRNKDFYVVESGEISSAELEDFITEIKNGYSSYALAQEIVQRIVEVYPTPCRLHLADGDKTTILQDSLRLCANNYKTKIFDGDFYTGYQSFLFEKETRSIPLDDTQLEQATLNNAIFECIQNEPFVVISAGITCLWNKLAEKYQIPLVIANPRISADTKYFVVKKLRALGYTVFAYGDGKVDLYMLRLAEKGYLYIGNKMSRSLKKANTKGLSLLYDMSPVILNKEHIHGLEEEIAICKSNSGICGKRLAKAHLQLGEKIGLEIQKILPTKNTAVLVLERGGRFFGDGVYMGFGGVFYPYNPKNQGLPTIEQENIIIVDSVIHTGKSILNIIAQLKEQNANANIIIAANVIQEHALPLFDEYKVFAVRYSTNSFVGKKQSMQVGNTGPDTADRLFNLIADFDI